VPWLGNLAGCWNGDRPQVDTNGKKKKRYKERCFGTVAESKSDRNWLVRWDRRGVASDEECSTFKLKHEGPGSDLRRPTNQEAAQQRSATQQQQAQPQGVVAPNAAVQDAAAAQQATRPPQQTRRTRTTAPLPQQTMTPTTTPAQQPRQAAVPLAETAVETVEETAARAAAEDANARTVDPDVPEEQDDRFDVANDFELVNLATLTIFCEQIVDLSCEVNLSSAPTPPP
jgi:hypothetical protein